MMRDPYVTAPPMDRERDALVLLAAELAATRPDPRIRELALRRAALAEREYRAEPSGWASEEARQAAFALISLDQADARAYGDPVPSDDWFFEPFTYVRREYAAWIERGGQAAAERAAGHQLRLLPDPPDDAPPPSA